MKPYLETENLLRTDIIFSSVYRLILSPLYYVICQNVLYTANDEIYGALVRNVRPRMSGDMILKVMNEALRNNK